MGEGRVGSLGGGARCRDVGVAHPAMLLMDTLFERLLLADGPAMLACRRAIDGRPWSSGAVITDQGRSRGAEPERITRFQGKQSRTTTLPSDRTERMRQNPVPLFLRATTGITEASGTANWDFGC